MSKTAKLPTPYMRRPDVAKETHSARGTGVFQGVSYALASMQGWRVTMEDAHFHSFPIPSSTTVACAGVFDGHAGKDSAVYAAKSVVTHIANTAEFRARGASDDPEYVAQGAAQGFLDCDAAMRNLPLFKKKTQYSGCTGVVALLTPTNIILANAGDSRCIIVRNNKVHFATKDHKPADPREKARVEKAGGKVVYGRVNGDLASARSFGDYRYKKNTNLPASQQQVTVMPDVTIHLRDPSDQLLILACDGIWDVMSNIECAHFVLAALRLGASLIQAAKLVLDECLRKSSDDNMSILIVAMEAAPEEMGNRQSKKSLKMRQVREEMLRNTL